MSNKIVEPLSLCDEAAIYHEETVARSMQCLVECQVRAEEELRGMFGEAHSIDEMAIMFLDPEALRRWVDAAVRVPGVVLFNTAHDSVATTPIPGRYNVHYWFLSVPPFYGQWRIEAMYAHSGSPLHDSLKRTMNGDDILVVHASFKCADEEAYGVATNTLVRNGYEVAQKCESTYGRFSYWRPEEAQNGVLLKPRLNIRDQENHDDLR